MVGRSGRSELSHELLDGIAGGQDAYFSAAGAQFVVAHALERPDSATGGFELDEDDTAVQDDDPVWNAGP